MAQIKTKEEIDNLKKACRETDAIFKNILKILHRSDLWKTHEVTEVKLRDFILGEIKGRGLKPSFPPIVTSGKNAGNDIHPKPTDKKLSGFVIIDLGVKVNGYCSDMTRTVFVGTPTLEQKKIYDLVLQSEMAGIREVKSGAHAYKIDEVCRKTLGRYAKYFIHMTGHGVGKLIHENPKIYFKLIKPVLAEGMVITVEPGLYIKNKLGIRIEDTILVTPKGSVILTKSDKSLIII
ncbi:MAG: M24 family metallopeptidase [Candidatus Pacebacteria bacterium]|nr:M24 family metallopeptidase [Candidatus Paceibacterota bacterium]MBP9716220.1 M24 family metallopeptidase [Candidatus Paceibacterota bacterium]